MKPTPKTIQIFLPGGNPRGIRIADITTRILQVIEVPRSLLSDFLKMPESDQVALYFLIGSPEDSEVYIGQTGDLRNRLTKHNKSKDFWERALIVTTRTNSMTQTHALFLEWHCIQAIRSAGRYQDQNNTSGSRPHTPAPLEADCLEIFDTASTLLATLGHPLFVPLISTVDASNDDERFYIDSTGVEGSGLYTSDGFVVLKDSYGRGKTSKSFAAHPYKNIRPDLIEKGICIMEEDRFVFKKDHLFSSPSKAAAMLFGRSSNGWTEWKDSSGKTLDEVKRQ